MRLAAMALLTALCGSGLAAPAPFLESAVPEAVLETGSKERAEALLRWLRATDLAQAVLPGQSALPGTFVGKLKATQKGDFRVVLKLQGGARAEERVLFERLVGKVTARPDTRNAELVASLEAGRAHREAVVRKLAMVRGMRGRFRGDEKYLERYLQQIQDQEIRANPPRLVVGPSRR